MTLQLPTPLPVLTPLGKAQAFFLWTDHEQSSQFGCFQDSSGEYWIWKQEHIRLQPCITNGHVTTSEIVLSDEMKKSLEPHLARHS